MSIWGGHYMSRWIGSIGSLVAGVFVAAMTTLIIYGAVAMIRGGPSEASLSQMTGTLGDVKVSIEQDGGRSFTFALTGSDNKKREFNMLSDYTAAKRELAATLASSQGQAAAVRYDAGILGDRAYEIVVGGVPLLSFTEVKSVLDAQAPNRRYIGWITLTLFGGIPLLFGVMFGGAKLLRTIRGGVATAIEPITVGRLGTAALWIPIAGTVASLFFMNPETLRSFIAVLGKDPLGISTPVVATACLIAATTPLAFAFSHLIAALRTTGRPARSLLSLLSALARDWSNPQVRHHAIRFFGGVLVFGALMIIWTHAVGRASG
jgi:hypothetical protein